jgi:hypothetical protein
MPGYAAINRCNTGSLADSAFVAASQYGGFMRGDRLCGVRLLENGTLAGFGFWAVAVGNIVGNVVGAVSENRA